MKSTGNQWLLREEELLLSMEKPIDKLYSAKFSKHVYLPAIIMCMCIIIQGEDLRGNSTGYYRTWRGRRVMEFFK